MTIVNSDASMLHEISRLVSIRQEDITLDQIKELNQRFTGSGFRHTFCRELTERLRSSNQEEKLNHIITMLVKVELAENKNFNMVFRSNTLAPCFLMFYLGQDFYAKIAAIIDKKLPKPKDMLREIGITLEENASSKPFVFVFSIMRDIQKAHNDSNKNTANEGLEFVSRLFLFSVFQTGLYFYHYSDNRAFPTERTKYLADMILSHYLITHTASLISGETWRRKPISLYQFSYSTIDLSIPLKKSVKADQFQQSLVEKIQKAQKIPVDITSIILDRVLFDDFKLHSAKAKMFDEIKNIIPLESLSLTDCELGSGAVLLFPTGDSNKFSALKKLHLKGNYLGGQEPSILPHLLDTTLCIDYLDLQYNLIKDKDIHNCSANISNNPHLKKLDLSNNTIKLKGARQLADTLKTNTVLCSLSLSGNDIGNEGAIALLEALNSNPHSSLTEIDLSETRIDYEGIIKICDLLMHNKKISHINLGGGLNSGCERPLVTKKIAELLKTNRQIKYLGLARRCLTDLIISDILDIAKSLTLTGIDLTDNWLSDTATTNLVTLFQDTPLISELILNENKNIARTKEDLSYLATLIAKTQKLSLRMTGINTNEITTLIEGIEQSKVLESIDLSNNTVGDQESLRIAVEKCKTLSAIKLDNCSLRYITEKCIKLIIQKRQISNEVAQKESLEDALPNEWNSLPSPLFEGLEYKRVPGDGHCLYRTIGEAVNLDQSDLRTLVAKYLSNNKEEFKDFIPLSGGRTIDNYIEDIGAGREWGSHIDIEIIMRALKRPIFAINPDSGLISQGTERFTNEPIFVYYNGIHYDALRVKAGYFANHILENLIRESHKLSLKKTGDSKQLDDSSTRIATQVRSDNNIRPQSPTENSSSFFYRDAASLSLSVRPSSSQTSPPTNSQESFLSKINTGENETEKGPRT